MLQEIIRRLSPLSLRLSLPPHTKRTIRQSCIRAGFILLPAMLHPELQYGAELVADEDGSFRGEERHSGCDGVLRLHTVNTVCQGRNVVELKRSLLMKWCFFKVYLCFFTSLDRYKLEPNWSQVRTRQTRELKRTRLLLNDY